MGDRPANLFSVLLLRESELVGFLKIEPKLGAGAEPLPEPERGLSCDASLGGDDLVDTVVGHSDFLAQSERRNPKLLKLVGKDLAEMDG